MKKWPEVNTAFLVIHGAGEHRPFEALDIFTRHFRNFLEAQNFKVQLKHKLERRSDWIESFVSMSVGSKYTIDIYEYYWDCYMVRGVTVREILKWLDDASAGAVSFYERDERMKDKKILKTAQIHEEASVPLFKHGKFKSHGYWAILGSLRMVRQLILLAGISPCRTVPRCLTGCIKCLRKDIFTSLEDLVIYTTSDVRSQNYEIRQKMLRGAVEELKLLLNDKEKDYRQIVVVGHSLGSVIAYDALNRINQSINIGDIPTDSVPKIAGLVTLGSPLDKVDFLFGERLLEKNLEKDFVRLEILDHLHSFKKRALPKGRRPAVSKGKRPAVCEDPDSVEVENPFKRHLDGARWLNFYHRKDLISGHLDAYDLDEQDNVECSSETVSGVGYHGCYWHLDNLYKGIDKTFL
jgi:hypothetical protein